MVTVDGQRVPDQKGQEVTKFTYLGRLVVRSYHLNMKRIVLLCLISAAFIYNILPAPEAGPQIDEIRTRMAASRARPDESRTAIHKVSSAGFLEPTSNDAVISTVSENAVTEEEGPESDLAQNDEVPWEDIRNGWRTDLKEFLIESDPDRGEEIFTAYMEESESFEAEIDALNKEADKAGKEAKGDFETLIGQLEVRHEEKLKEILGNYYSDVTDRHQQYNASLDQYSNGDQHSTVGVSL